ncbi:MAG: hypothetical protein V3R94_06335 [Acidobacteriota bacterium]
MSIFDDKYSNPEKNPISVKAVGSGRWQILRSVLQAILKRLADSTTVGLLPMMKAVGLGSVFGLVILLGYGLVETVNQGSYQVRQMIVTGKMDAKLVPGMWLQLFSDIVIWPKAETFFFATDETGSAHIDRAIEVRFNDGSLCDVSGTLRIILPDSEQQAIDLVTKYGYANYGDLEQKLILPVVRNALRLTANLMSARESYSEKRADYVFWAWDQIKDGIYETEEETRKVIDPVSGQEVTKTFKIIKKMADGSPAHQHNPLQELGITLTNFEVKLFDYTEKVREQIGTQQTALMAVATAMAKAQQAEQEALMEEAEGKAKVARAKYEEEQKKIRALVQAQERLEVAGLEKSRARVKAQERLEVAELDRKAAGETKQEEILLGQGEAERKRLVLQADGALKEKLEAYVKAQGFWASAYSQRQVPALVMGGPGAGDTDQNSTDFAQMMQLLVAKQMGLDLSVRKGPTRD